MKWPNSGIAPEISGIVVVSRYEVLAELWGMGGTITHNLPKPIWPIHLG
jgi:hypothetical protein